MAIVTATKECKGYNGYLCEDTKPFVNLFREAYEKKHGVRLNIAESVHEILKSLSKNGIDSIQPK